MQGVRPGHSRYRLHPYRAIEALACTRACRASSAARPGGQCMSPHGVQCISYHGSQCMSCHGSQCLRCDDRLPRPRSGRIPRPTSLQPHPEHGEGGEAEMQLADVLLDAGAPRRPRHQPQVQRREAAPDAHARLRVFSRAFSLDDTRAAALALARALVRAGERMREPSRESQLTAKASALLDCRCWVALPAPAGLQVLGRTPSTPGV